MLAKVDWRPVINAVKRAKQHEDLESIHIEVPLPQEIRELRDYYQYLIENSGIPEDLHPLTRNLDRADSIHKSIPDCIKNLIIGMIKEQIYSDSQISDACNIYISYMTCHIGHYLQVLPDKVYPSLSDLEDISAYVFECKKDELLVLEAASYPDEKGHKRKAKGVVPISFLNNCKELLRWVERIRENHPQAGIRSVFQLFPHAFEILFTTQEKLELWSHYMLPISLCRYSKEDVIFSPYEVEACGLP